VATTISDVEWIERIDEQRFRINDTRRKTQHNVNLSKRSATKSFRRNSGVNFFKRLSIPYPMNNCRISSVCLSNKKKEKKEKNKTFLSSMRVAFRQRGQKIKQQEKKMRENSDRQVRIPQSLFKKELEMRQRPTVE
jgi:hypothetical protein